MARKKIAIAAGAVLLVLVVLVLALPYVVDVNQYRGRVEAELQQRLDRQVSLGQMRLSLWPLGIRVEDAAIGEDPQFATERPFASADELYVSPRVWPLLRGAFELRAVELRRPAIELVRGADGVWNFSTIGGARAGSPPPADDEPAPAFVLNRLVITSGVVAVTDRQRGADRAVYENINLQLDGYAPDRAFDFDLSAVLPGEGAQRLALRGTAGPIAPDDPASTPFDGSLTVDDVSISGLQQFLELEALEGTDAVISGSAELQNAAGRVASRGSLDLAGARLRGVDIGYPVALDYELAHDLQAQVLTITSGTLRLDGTPLSLTGTVNLAPDTPVLDVHVTAADTALAEIARLAAAAGVAFGTDVRVQGTLDADVRARGPANRPALDGSLRLRDVEISGADIPQPVRTPAIDLSFTPDEVRSNDFTVATGNTSLGARFAAREYTTETPVIDAALRTSDADLGELLNVARAWGVAAADGTSGSGRLSLDVRAAGPTTALTYSGSGSLRDATLQPPSLTQPLRVRSAALTFSEDAAILENLAASLGGTTLEGRFSLRHFTAPQVDFALSADRVDVAELQAIFASGSPAATPAPASAAQQPAADGVLVRTTGGGTMQIGTVVYTAIELNDVQARATLDRGVIRLDPITAGLFGGQHRGTIVMDARQTPAAFSVNSELIKVDANRLVSAVTNLRDVIHGPLGARVDMRFSGDQPDALARSLTGTMSIALTDGRIAHMDLRQEIGNIARFVTGQAPAERATQVARLNGTFAVADGVATTDDLTVGIADGSLSARGSINLVDQSVDLRLMAVLSPEATQRVGGTQIGGLLTTALANQQGELVVPMRVTGALPQPRFAPDAQLVAEMRLKNLVPSGRNPGELVTGVLDALRGRGAQQPPPADGQEPARQSPRDTVGDVLGGIFGRGRQAPQPAPSEAEPAPAEPPPADPPPAAPPPQNLDAPSADEATRAPAGRLGDVVRGWLQR